MSKTYFTYIMILCRSSSDTLQMYSDMIYSRSGSSMTSYSDLGACGGGPSLGDTPDEFQDILGRHSFMQ